MNCPPPPASVLPPSRPGPPCPYCDSQDTIGRHLDRVIQLLDKDPSAVKSPFGKHPIEYLMTMRLNTKRLSETTIAKWKALWARIKARFPEITKRIHDVLDASSDTTTISKGSVDSLGLDTALLGNYFDPPPPQALPSPKLVSDSISRSLRALHIGGGSTDRAPKQLCPIPWSANSCAIDSILELVRRLEVPNMTRFEDTPLTDLQRGFVQTLDLLQDANDDALMVHSKLPYLRAARRSNGFAQDHAVHLPIGPTFSETLLTGGVLPSLTNVLHTGNVCGCGNRSILSLYKSSIELTIHGPSIEVMLDLFWKSTELRCTLCKEKTMSRTRRLNSPVTALVVDVAWEHPKQVAISPSIIVPVWEQGSRTRVRFALTGGIVHRGRHFMAFWRDPATRQWCVYDGMKAWSERVCTLAVLPGSPSMLIYIPETEVVVLEPSPLVLPHVFNVHSISALIDLTIGSYVSGEEFYIDVSPGMRFEEFVALVQCTESQQLRGCRFVEGVFLRAAGKRVRFVNERGWSSGLAGAFGDLGSELSLQVTFAV